MTTFMSMSMSISMSTRIQMWMSRCPGRCVRPRWCPCPCDVSLRFTFQRARDGGPDASSPQAGQEPARWGEAGQADKKPEENPCSASASAAHRVACCILARLFLTSSIASSSSWVAGPCTSREVAVSQSALLVSSPGACRCLSIINSCALPEGSCCSATGIARTLVPSKRTETSGATLGEAGR